MAKVMKKIAWISTILTISVYILYQFQPFHWLLSFDITLATVSYHFVIRLLIGHLFDRYMKNQADYTKSWYQLRSWEISFYDKIQVKKWKKNVPTYQPEYFSVKHHTWHEIAQAMCQAELVHETIIIFSFLPIFASRYVGAFFVFLLTSIGAALFDTMFVVMQRYNRPRIIRMILKNDHTT